DVDDDQRRAAPDRPVAPGSRPLDGSRVCGPQAAQAAAPARRADRGTRAAHARDGRSAQDPRCHIVGLPRRGESVTLTPLPVASIAFILMAEACGSAPPEDPAGRLRALVTRPPSDPTRF